MRLKWDQRRHSVTVVAMGTVRSPGMEPCLGTARRCSNLLQGDLATQETRESHLLPEAVIQGSSWWGGACQKRGLAEHSHWGARTFQALTLSHACAFSLPRDGDLDGFSYPVPFFPIWKSGKQGEAFPIGTLLFPSLSPWRVGQAAGMWGSTCVPGGTACCNARPSL